MRPLYVACLVIIIGSLCGIADATVIWDESVNGNLSGAQASPSAFTLAPGVSSIIGNVGTGATQDWIDLTIPAGFQLSSDVLAAYTSSDAQGFTGVQAGTSFIGSVNSPGSYLGYAHFGTGATNGSIPSTNLVGADLLPLMGNKVTVSPGSAGFTPPLPAGSYAFLIQQLGASTGYQFDFGVTAVPEPTCISLLGAGCCALILRNRERASA